MNFGLVNFGSTNVGQVTDVENTLFLQAYFFIFLVIHTSYRVSFNIGSTSLLLNWSTTCNTEGADGFS